MMSLQMPSAHPRVGRKREKAAICSMMGGTLPACCLGRLRQIDLAAAFGRLLFRRGCATTPAAYLSTLVPYREGPKIRRAERMVSQYGRPPLNRGGGCSARSQTLHQCQCPAPFLGDAPPAIDLDHHSLREVTNIRKARREAIGTFTPIRDRSSRVSPCPASNPPSRPIHSGGSPRSSAPLPESSPAASSIGRPSSAEHVARMARG
jgi:hypothetical protein